MIEEETFSQSVSQRERERERLTTTLHGLMLFSAVDYDAWIIYSQNMILNLLL